MLKLVNKLRQAKDSAISRDFQKSSKNHQKLKIRFLNFFIESVKSADTIKMPVTATILRINEDLMENALIANRDPEKTGWFVEIQVDNKADSDDLLSKQQYEDHCAGLSEEWISNFSHALNIIVVKLFHFEIWKF